MPLRVHFRICLERYDYQVFNSFGKKGKKVKKQLSKTNVGLYWIWWHS